MSREQLLDLANELDRLLTAGARAATGSDALRRRAKIVEELSTKVAALVPLRDAIQKVLTAPAKDAPQALLDLLSIARQMRAGLGDSSVPGEIGSLLTRQGCQTPTGVKRAHELHDHFTGGGSGKHSALEEAIKNREIHDLRLHRAFLDALDDADGTFADRVSREVLPQLGQAVLPDLLAGLNIAEGESADARRLQAICLIDKKQGVELVHKALKDGSLKVLAQALECLPDVLSATEAEKIGLEYAQEKRATIRAAALKALRTSASDACLDLVLQKTSDKSQEVTQVAYEMLGSMPHPDTTNRLMATIREQLDNLTEVPKQTTTKKTTKGAAKTPAKGKATPAPKKLTADEIAALQTKRYEELNRCQGLLLAMSNRNDLRRKEVAKFIEPLINHKETQVETPVRSILIKVGPVIPEVVPMLKKLIEKVQGWQLHPIVEMMKELKPEQRTDLLPHVLKSANKGYLHYGVGQTLLQMLRDHAQTDPKPFTEFMNRCLASKEHWLWNAAINTLLDMPSKEAAPYLPEAIGGYMAFITGSYYMPPYDDLVKLIRRDDPELKVALPIITRALPTFKKAEGKINLLLLLAEFGHVALAAKPVVETLVKDRNKDVKEQAGKTLETIQTA